MNKKLPTAKEFLKKFKKKKGLRSQVSPLGSEGMEKEAMVEFAKLHVEAALKAASESESDGTEGYKIYKDSILNAYPLENIK